ncbi:protein NRT1/ PTR FAMILY 5.4-like [Vicia villosa]|uniref:protein NRT1/ PTR FAMILY 5.4-like n=1 Tax=Vicia villosa TaxID=3911 RepID=UPI00273B6DEA|nr:protein NRT1/ PTR FAMILY 5.4-like [Vicia villosa]XP_058784853.1 protein NRT1/ PTR FAMILY 5.4-like [Vicia villosa]
MAVEENKRDVKEQPTKTKKGGWHAAIFIIVMEAAEQFANIGLGTNLILYLTQALNEPVTEAAKNRNTWVGVSSIFPLLGGFIADSYLGRFKTIIIASLIYLMGMILLTASVSILKNTKLFFIALYILSLGDGGHKPCVQTFAADQFSEDTMEEKDAKRSFFNWWYLSIVIGSVFAVFVIGYLMENVSWTVGLVVLASILAVALSIFLLGMKRYTKERPTGSPITSIARVFVAASRKWRVKNIRGRDGYWYGYDHDRSHHSQSPSFIQILAHTNQYKFLDKAMIIDEQDTSKENINPWRLCSMNQVEEVKLVIRLIPIWLSCLMFTVVQSQLGTFFVKQSSTLDRSMVHNFIIPPTSLQGLVGVVILFAVPIYDKVFVPFARKITGHHSGITVLQRIGFGLFLSIFTMSIAALVETKRISVAKNHNLLDNTHGKEISIPMSIWWMLPQYAICGVSDAFTIVGLQELFYDQMPDTMKSLGAAAYLSIVGVGSFVSNGIINLVVIITSKTGEKWLGSNVNRAHLNYFYGLLAMLSALNLCVYVWITKGFVYKRRHVVETSTV